MKTRQEHQISQPVGLGIVCSRSMVCLSGSFLCLFVCLFVVERPHLCVCCSSCICESCICRPQVILLVLPRVLFPFWGWCQLTDWAGWLASKPQESSYLLLPQFKNTNVHNHTQLSVTRHSEDQTRVLRLTGASTLSNELSVWSLFFCTCRILRTED